MAERNANEAVWPIYVGKAIPSGGRKGADLFIEIRGRHLWKRLREHADTIKEAKNLDIIDFQCRYLIVDDIWIPLGETLLISRFKPVWNLALDGFGNHDPGAGRYQGLRPRWDVLHAGRGWAEKCQQRSETADELAARVSSFLEQNPPPAAPRIRFEPQGD
jgi:hypothetical protein